MAIWPSKLFHKLLLAYIALPCALLLLLGSAFIILTSRHLTAGIHRANLEVARRGSEEIRLYLEKGRDVLRAASGDPALLEEDGDRRLLGLHRLRRRFPMFERIWFCDARGKPLAGTDWEEGSPSLDAVPWRPPLESTGKRSGAVTFFNRDGIPVVRTWEPVTVLGRPAGFLAADLNLQMMWTLVDRIVLGADGYSYVVDGSGLLLAHPRKGKVYSQVDMSGLEVVRRIATGESGVIEYRNIDGEAVIGAFTPIEGTGWGMVTEEPLQSAFALVTRMKWTLSLCLLLCIGLAAVVGHALARRFTRPIHLLVDFTERIGSGDLAARIPPGTRDEIGLLIERFNQMAARLRENTARLAQAEKEATMSKFASIISHEIRNPLNAMVINMEIARRELAKPTYDEARISRTFGVVMSEIGRLNGIIENYLRIARPFRLSFGEADLARLLKEMIVEQESAARKQRISLELRLPDSPVTVTMDTDKIKQALLNMMINAFQAMPGDGRLRISCRKRARDNEEWALIRLLDTGLGIPPDRLEEIFDFHYTTRKDGTGIGLTVAARIVEKHGGSISVRSREGRGTAFSIRLPCHGNEREEHDER